MPGVANYLPARTKDFNNWLVAFAKQTSATPWAYGLTAADAATIANHVAEWSTAYLPVTSPATKTAVTVAAKNAARVIVTARIRTFAQAIANNPGVSSGNKTGLGLNPGTRKWTHVTAPNTRPVLSFQSASPLAAILRYRDSDGVSTKAKPYGVVQCRVFGQSSPEPIADRTTLPLIATPTKSPFILTFADGQAGQTIYLAARWATRTGLTGPWSSIIKFIVTA